MPFLLALGSPFNCRSPAVLSPSTALCEDQNTVYSLFFNGLWKVYHLFLENAIRNLIRSLYL